MYHTCTLLNLSSKISTNRSQTMQENQCAMCGVVQCNRLLSKHGKQAILPVATLRHKVLIPNDLPTCVFHQTLGSGPKCGPQPPT